MPTILYLTLTHTLHTYTTCSTSLLNIQALNSACLNCFYIVYAKNSCKWFQCKSALPQVDLNTVVIFNSALKCLTIWLVQLTIWLTCNYYVQHILHCASLKPRDQQGAEMPLWSAAPALGAGAAGKVFPRGPAPPGTTATGVGNRDLARGA